MELGALVQDMVALQQQQAELSAQLGRTATSLELAAAVGCEAVDVQARLERGAAAKQRLVGSNMRLVVCIARKYQGHGIGVSDLVAEGINGLNRGAEKFDPSKVGWTVTCGTSL